MFPLAPLSLPRRRLVGLVAVALMMTTMSHAVLFYDTADSSHNTTAPTSTLAGSGWQYEGVFGGFLGTAIAPNYFITAAHIGVASSTFVQTSTFTGVADATYIIDATAFSGAGYYDLPGTDLRLYRTVEAFSTWAPLYSGTSELSSSVVIMGNGGARGNPVTLGADLKGWLPQSANGTTRWGTNVVSGIVPDVLSPVGDLLSADFNALTGTDEAMLSSGDSGGAMFINDGGVWKLAGIHYAVDGGFNTSPTDVGAFGAALFDKGGYWEGSGSNWTFNSDTLIDTPASFYTSRISSSAAAINSITGVPEPGSLALLLVGSLMIGRRRR